MYSQSLNKLSGKTSVGGKHPWKIFPLVKSMPKMVNKETTALIKQNVKELKKIIRFIIISPRDNDLVWVAWM